MNQTLPDLLDAFIAKTDNSIYFKSGETQWSPSMLHGSVLRWAQFLVELGVKPGDRIGIYLKKSLEEMGLILAITYVGAIFIDIHSSNKFQQLQHICSDCDIEVLFSSRQLLRGLGSLLTKLKLRHIITVDDPKDLVVSCSVHSLQDASSLSGLVSSCRPRMIDDDFATVLYTSGSTGRPRGIIQTHRNLVEGARIVSHYLKNVQEDRVLSLLPFSFDYGLNQLLSGLYVGFSLVLQDYFLPLDTLNFVAKEGITGLAGVPTILLDLLGVMEKNPELDLSSLRYITNSGGKLYPTSTQRLRKRLQSTEIFLMYGLTEAFRSTFLPPDQVVKRPESIGKAIPNVSVHVINEHGNECKPGELGELIHRGALIAKGYWGDKKKMEEVFRPNPLLDEHLRFTETVVYSGDIVWRDEEGFLYFVGRRDNMIKSRGHRISPDEITEVLLRMEGVQNAAIVGIENEDLGQKIVAFVQVPDTASITEKDCKEFVEKFLPAHMVPSEMRLLKQLPTNNNGKVDLVELKKRATYV